MYINLRDPLVLIVSDNFVLGVYTKNMVAKLPYYILYIYYTAAVN